MWFNVILRLTNSLLKHSLVRAWGTLPINLHWRKIYTQKTGELVNNQLSGSARCHSIPTASRSAEFLNVEPRCKNNKDHIKVMLIIQAMALEEDAEVLGRLIQDWGKDNAAYNCFFQITCEGKKVSVPLPNLLACSLGHLRPCTHAHTHEQGSQPLCTCGTFQTTLGEDYLGSDPYYKPAMGCGKSTFFYIRLSRELVISLETPQLPNQPCERSPSPHSEACSALLPLLPGDRTEVPSTVGPGARVASCGWQRSPWKAM